MHVWCLLPLSLLQYWHNSDPLGDYDGMGGYGWQIVDIYNTPAGVNATWTYMPTGCPVTAPVNSDEFGGGTFAGMGPSLNGGVCSTGRDSFTQCGKELDAEE